MPTVHGQALLIVVRKQDGVTLRVDHSRRGGARYRSAGCQRMNCRIRGVVGMGARPRWVVSRRFFTQTIFGGVALTVAVAMSAPTDPLTISPASCPFEVGSKPHWLPIAGEDEKMNQHGIRETNRLRR